MAKALGKWFHDPVFDTLHPLQWKFLAQQLALDDHEEAEIARDRAEYMMMFMNNEGVQKVRKAREASENKLNDDAFSQQLESMFGRGLPGVEKRDQIESTLNQDLDEIKIVK